MNDYAHQISIDSATHEIINKQRDLCIERDNVKYDDTEKVYVESNGHMLNAIQILKRTENKSFWQTYSHDLHEVFFGSELVQQVTLDNNEKLKLNRIKIEEINFGESAVKQDDFIVKKIQ